jgi:hypothetical protein
MSAFAPLSGADRTFVKRTEIGAHDPELPIGGMAGLNMVHVPYRGGGAAMADLLSGQLQVYIGAMTSSLEYVKASRRRALAVSTRRARKRCPRSRG